MTVVLITTLIPVYMIYMTDVDQHARNIHLVYPRVYNYISNSTVTYYSVQQNKIRIMYVVLLYYFCSTLVESCTGALLYTSLGTVHTARHMSKQVRK